MIKRRRIAVLGVLAAVAASIFVLPASSASAVTYTNACRNTAQTANWDQVNVTLTGTAPATVAAGGSVPLTNIQQTLAVPGAIFVAGYNLGLLTTGVNNIPTDFTSVIDAANTVELSQTTNTVSQTLSTTITDPDGVPGSGDETGTDASATVTFADETWTAGASGTIGFHEHNDPAVTPTLGGGIRTNSSLAGGLIHVQFRCTSGTVAGMNPGVPTFTNAPTFASTTIGVVTPAPTVTALNPTHGPAAGGTSVTITGTDLTGATAVNFGANAATFTVDSATQITATAPAGTAGTTVEVAVTTPAGTNPTPNGTANDYTYDAVVPTAPTVTALNPTHGPAAGGTSVVITGTNFTGATAVMFGANAATFTVDSATQITATAPAGTAGTTVEVTVTTPAGTNPTPNGTANDYTYDAVVPTAPTVTALNPTHGPAAGGTSVVITGTNFTGATAVMFGANAATFTVDSATQITATAPAGTAGTTVEVTVTTPAGTNPTPNGTANDYTYDAVVPTAPTVTALNPTHGPAAGGTSVVITGTNFTGATAVMFGANAATFTVDSATQITATAPAGTAGTTVEVAVTTPAGTNPTPNGTANDYTYDAVVPTAPTVTALNPTHGPAAGGTSVVITGTNFTGATAVMFGANAATFTVDSATQITATAPAGTAGTTVEVAVTTPAGTNPTPNGTANDYTYDAVVPTAPTVTALNPTHGPAAGGTSVVITGTNFTGATAVMFGANAATFTVDSATQITATAPAGTAGTTVEVTVTTPAGTNPTPNGTANDYTYDAVVPTAPTVTALNPTHGPAAGGNSVVITGTNFTGATAVMFGANAATFTVDSATQITATAPAGTAGTTVEVTVTTPAGTNPTPNGTANDYTYDAVVPTGIDAAGEVVVNGKIHAKTDHKVYFLLVTNLGDSPITVDPTTDIDASVLVNGTENGSVTPLTGPKTIAPGHTRRFPLRWNGDGPLASGDTVEFTACVNLAGDSDPTNDCGSETRTAVGKDHSDHGHKDHSDHGHSEGDKGHDKGHH